MNFENFIEYLRKEKGYSTNTLIAYVNDLRQFEKVIKDSCGTENETEVTSSMLRVWMVSLKEKGVSNRSIGRKVACIRLYFNYLMREGEIKVNPMLKIVAPKIQKSTRDYVFANEMERLLKIKSETFVHALDEKEIYISTKSACSSSNSMSNSVYALTKDKDLSNGSLRISLSYMTTDEEIDKFLLVFDECYKKLEM